MEALLADTNEQIEIAGSGYVAIATRDLKRTVRFYSRLFGFRVIERRTRDDAAHVLLAARGDVFVAVHEGGLAASAARATRWTFRVPDLDRVREALWNQGVVPLRDGTLEAPAGAGGERRDLVIRDPNGHEIELVEAAL